MKSSLDGFFIIPYIRMKIKKNPTEAVNVPASVGFFHIRDITKMIVHAAG